MISEIDRIYRSVSQQEKLTVRKMGERMATILILNLLAVAALLAAHYVPR